MQDGIHGQIPGAPPSRRRSFLWPGLESGAPSRPNGTLVNSIGASRRVGNHATGTGSRSSDLEMAAFSALTQRRLQRWPGAMVHGEVEGVCFGSAKSLLYGYAVKLGLVKNDLLERVVGDGADRDLAPIDHQDRGLGDVDVFSKLD
jgi:hypothetical protein